MLRVFCSANPDPELFWRLTFDEVLAVIQGQVDRWRRERTNSYNLYCSWCEKPVSIFDYSPLPYDDELKQSETIMSDIELYNLVSQSWN